jgi:glycosyltransferase involved in cell wall biosynthesis
VVKKRRVLFVGSFIEKAKDGSVGGQMYACRSIIASDLNSYIDWILLDTTGESVPPPHVVVRLFFAIKRVFKFIFLLGFKKPESVLIFTANTPSIFEKGLMALIASFFSINVIIAPRGGPLDKEIENNKLVRIFVQLVFNRATYIICQGRYWKSFFSKLVDKNKDSKFVVIPNWIDSSLYDIFKIKKREDTILRLLYMGWIQEDKGVHDIFSAIKKLPLINRQLEFIFLGDGHSRQFFIEMTKNENLPFLFSFPGWVHGEEKLNYLANADVFILASHSEGLPNSLMEAMLCGIPSIATNVGSVSDLIINGETGILIEKQNIEQLADGINQLINNENLRAKFSIEGKKRILSNHSILSATDSFKKILL